MRCINLIRLGLMSFVLFSCGQEQTSSSTGMGRFSDKSTASNERTASSDKTASSDRTASSEAPVSREAGVSSDIQVETLIQTTQSWNGSPLPDYTSEHPQMTALRITIPAHTKLPVHRHPVINAGILLRGHLTVISEAGDTLQIKAGDPIVEMVNQWHHGENNGDEPAEIVVFYSGNVDVPVTILKESQKADPSPQQGNSHDPYH